MIFTLGMFDKAFGKVVYVTKYKGGKSPLTVFNTDYEKAKKFTQKEYDKIPPKKWDYLEVENEG